MKTLIILGHPTYKSSRVNKAFIEAIDNDDIIVNNIYEEYPDWKFDFAREHKLLEEADRIVLQFPLYWYSTPSLIKKWIDEVLSYGFAYGPDGDKLKGKEFLVVTTAGAGIETYKPAGKNMFTIYEFLRPIQITAKYIGTKYLSPFIFYGASYKSKDKIVEAIPKYLKIIEN